MQKKKRYGCLNVLLIFIQIVVATTFVVVVAGPKHSDWESSEIYPDTTKVDSICHSK